MADKIRVGIVGATVTKGGSGWGADAHVPALKALPNYELKAICTSHEDTAKASKEMFNIELAFHNIKDMVAHPDIDLIAVVVRVPDHAALVEAAVAAGTTLPRILLRHILPNTTAPLLVQGTYVCASAMITEAILSFIGAGTPPNIPSWGNIMAEARSLFQIAGYLILFPGICLSLTVLAVNLLGDGMRDALDPRLARRM